MGLFDDVVREDESDSPSPSSRKPKGRRSRHTDVHVEKRLKLEDSVFDLPYEDGDEVLEAPRRGSSVFRPKKEWLDRADTKELSASGRGRSRRHRDSGYNFLPLVEQPTLMLSRRKKTSRRPSSSMQSLLSSSASEDVKEEEKESSDDEVFTLALSPSAPQPAHDKRKKKTRKQLLVKRESSSSEDENDFKLLIDRGETHAIDWALQEDPETLEAEQRHNRIIIREALAERKARGFESILISRPSILEEERRRMAAAVHDLEGLFDPEDVRKENS